MYDFSKMQFNNHENLQCNCLGNSINDQGLKIAKRQETSNIVNNNLPSFSNIKKLFKTSLRKQKSSHDFGEINKTLQAPKQFIQFNQTTHRKKQNQIILNQQRTKSQINQLKTVISNSSFYKGKESLKMISMTPKQKVQPIQFINTPKNNNSSTYLTEASHGSHNNARNIIYSHSDHKNTIYPQISSPIRKPTITFTSPKEIKSTPILQQCQFNEQSLQYQPTIIILQQKREHKQWQPAQCQTNGIKQQFKDDMKKYLGQSLQLPTRVQSQDFQFMRIQSQNISSSLLSKSIVQSQINNKKSLISKKGKVYKKQVNNELKRMQDVEEISSIPDSENMSVSDKESIVLGKLVHGSMVQPKIHYSTDLSHLSSTNNNKIKQN